METVLSPIAKRRQREVLLDDSRGCLSGCVGRRVDGDLYNFVRDLCNFLKLALFQFIKLDALVSDVEGLHCSVIKR